MPGPWVFLGRTHEDEQGKGNQGFRLPVSRPQNLVLGYDDPTTGKRVTKSAKTPDEPAANRMAAVWEDELRSGRYQAPSRVTWEEFKERYEGEKLAALAPSTKKAALQALGHLQRVIGPDLLAKLTAAVMSKFQAKLRADGMKTSTLAKTLRHVRAALSWGVSIGLACQGPRASFTEAEQGANDDEGAADHRGRV